MKIYTAHTKPHSKPVLIREGFSSAGLLLGPIWLVANRVWLAGALAGCADILIAVFATGDMRYVLASAISWAIGLFGHDMQRWWLDQQGYQEVHVIAAPDADTAFARLLDRRPDLIGDAVGAELYA